MFSIVEMSIFCVNKVVMYSNLYLEKENKDFRMIFCIVMLLKVCGCVMLWLIFILVGIVYLDRMMFLEEVLIFLGVIGRSLWKKNRDVCGCLVFWNRVEYIRFGGSVLWVLYCICVFFWLWFLGRIFCWCGIWWFFCCF